MIVRRTSIPYEEALRDQASLARALAELGFSEPSPDGTGLHEKIIGGEKRRVIVIKRKKLIYDR
jgi:hypothetical protein